MPTPASWWTLTVLLGFMVGCAEGNGVQSGGGNNGQGTSTDAGDASRLTALDGAAGEDGGEDVSPTGDLPPSNELDGAFEDADGPLMSTDESSEIDVPGLDAPSRMDTGVVCGDGLCSSTETCTSCPADCGTCPSTCGDGTCNGSETCTTCPVDCGACPARCGDGTCNGTETCTTCPADCGACPSPCASATSCGTCSAMGSCGWCANVNECLAGSASGPTNGACTGSNWAWTASACMSTAPDPCNSHGSCSSCLNPVASYICDWCASAHSCVTPGTPVDLSCDDLDSFILDCL